jgi:NADH dehydrogenase
VKLTLIDRRNFHLFQPLLYQVATGALSPGEIASPLRGVVGKNRNTEVVLGEVRDLDVAKRSVILDEGTVPYDDLIIATGATHTYFGHDDWESAAPGLKTIEDATAIRARLLVAFERAERETDEAKQRA